MAQQIVGPDELISLRHDAEFMVLQMRRIRENIERLIQRGYAYGDVRDKEALDALKELERKSQSHLDIIDLIGGPHQNARGGPSGGEPMGDYTMTVDQLNRIRARFWRFQNKAEEIRVNWYMPDREPRGQSRVPGGDIGNGKPRMRGGRLPLVEASIEQKNRLAEIIREFARDRENDEVFRPSLSELRRIESDHGAAVRTFEESTDDANKASDFERSDRDIHRRMYRVIDRVRNRKYELAAAFRDEMRRSRPEYVSDDPSSRNDMVGGGPGVVGDPPHSAPYSQYVATGQIEPSSIWTDSGMSLLRYLSRIVEIQETSVIGGLDSTIVNTSPIHTSGDVDPHRFIHFVTK
jgi:hypothetical protein